MVVTFAASMPDPQEDERLEEHDDVDGEEQYGHEESEVGLGDESTNRSTSEPIALSRIPPELQAIFLLAGRGETVNEPPPDGIGNKVFRRPWQVGRRKKDRKNKKSKTRGNGDFNVSVSSTTTDPSSATSRMGRLKAMFRSSSSSNKRGVVFTAPSIVVYDKKLVPSDTCLSSSRWQTGGKGNIMNNNNKMSKGDSNTSSSKNVSSTAILRIPQRRPLEPMSSMNTTGTNTTICWSNSSSSILSLQPQKQQQELPPPPLSAAINTPPRLPSRSRDDHDMIHIQLNDNKSNTSGDHDYGRGKVERTRSAPPVVCCHAPKMPSRSFD